MLASILLSALIPTGADVRLATDYSTERSLRVSVESSIELEVTSLEIQREGEEPRSSQGGSSSKHSRSIVHVDHLKAHADGRPTRVERMFEDVVANSVVRFGDEEREDQLDSPLKGVTLELERDAQDEVHAKVIDGDTPKDRAALEGHRLELALDALLPEDAVAVGATWKIDADAARRVLLADVMPALFAGAQEDAQGDDAESRARQRALRQGSAVQLLMQAEWTGTAKLASAADEEDGVEYAVIECEIEAKGEMPDPEMRFGGRGRMADPFGRALPFARTEYDVKLTGTLRFALKEKRPQSLELEGSVRIESEVDREGRDGGKVHIHSVREGPIEHKVTVTSVD